MMTSKQASLDGWIEENAHTYLMRVQFEDTDAGGIVYHANYLAFAERARSAYLRCLDIRQEDALVALQNAAGSRVSPPSDAVLFVVRRASIEYLRAAGLGAALIIETRMLKIGGASVKLEQTIKNFENGHILARLFVDIGCVGAASDGSKRAQRMPHEVAEKLRRAIG
jgi:acyl-CoA thioester hydrolase